MHDSYRAIRGGILMSEIIEIQRTNKKFAAAEASFIAPLLRSITSKYVSQVEPILSQLELMPKNQEDKINTREEKANGLIREWHLKVKKLGGDPRGLWVVDLPGDNGKYRWRHGDPEGLFWIPAGSKVGNKMTLVEGSTTLN